jgi:hypothetical protein
MQLLAITALLVTLLSAAPTALTARQDTPRVRAGFCQSTLLHQTRNR